VDQHNCVHLLLPFSCLLLGACLTSSVNAMPHLPRYITHRRNAISYKESKSVSKNFIQERL